MSWAIGWCGETQRWIGYGVPAYCDHPGCMAEIDRGLAFVCGNDVYGGAFGCGLFFCSQHRSGAHSRCSRCTHGRPPYRAGPEHPSWIRHLLTDPSWAEWRLKEPRELQRLISRQPEALAVASGYCGA